MNSIVPPRSIRPDTSELDAALETLARWRASASADEINALDNRLPRNADLPFNRSYPADFTVDEAYKASMPDLQNGPASLISGAPRQIQHVGISNFRLPLRYRLRDGSHCMLETSVTGSVSLAADRKGINMSRIMRSFYGHAEDCFGLDTVEAVLDSYKADLDSLDARVMLSFSLPLKVGSLRSGLQGYQYYDISLELWESNGQRLRIVHIDYVYSSTCPCSLELSEHARTLRGQLATPHSQRSVARLSAVLRPGEEIAFEDLVELCRQAVPTETQVMVKREDEQAFAELNASNPIFVEDAVRLFAEGLLAEPRIGDFRVVASHQESLHSHDAVSVLCEGPTFAGPLDPDTFSALRR